MIYGTASLGLSSYGSSWGSMSSRKDRESFLKSIIDLGIYHFDTASRYGDAESIVGAVIKDRQCDNLIIDTKVDGLIEHPDPGQNAQIVLNNFQNSTKNLNVEVINTLYLHQSDVNYLNSNEILDALSYIKSMGYVNNIGASIYSMEEFNTCEKHAVFDIVQVPFNLLNSSFVKKSRMKLVARSIYAQGRLFEKNEGKWNMYTKEFAHFHFLCRKYSVDVVRCTKWYLTTCFEGEYIFSTLSLDRLNIQIASDNYIPPKAFLKELYEIQDIGYTFTNPRNW